MPSASAARDAFLFDAARALAALAVVAAHARTMICQDAAKQRALGWFGESFFAITGFGHQAVVIFFVISGALVTRSLLDPATGVAAGWRLFATRRLVRLLVVLLPCLALGCLEDRLGIAAADPARFYGAAGLTPAAVAAHLGWVSFAGNLAFLQGPRLPVFGSNAPLWTLSLEAWCYALGFVLLSFRRQPTLRNGTVVVGFGAAALCVFGTTIWQYFPLWLIGSAVALRRPSPGVRLQPAWLLVLLLACALIASRALPSSLEIAGAYAIALATANALANASSFNPASTQVKRLARNAAGFSYSLYLSHFPLLALLSATLLHQRRLTFGIGALALWMVAMTAAIGLAASLWWLCERHTSRVRQIVEQIWRSPSLALRERVAP